MKTCGYRKIPFITPGIRITARSTYFYLGVLIRKGAVIAIGALINKTALKGERLLEKERLLEGGR